MKKSILITRGVVGLTGILQIVLGILFWTGHALSFVSFHMWLGILFVLALWTLAVVCARSGAPAGMVIAAFVWGVVILGFGLMQVRILPGPSHWIVRVLHLLFGIAGMGVAGAMTARTRASKGGSAGFNERGLGAPRTA